MPSSAPGPHRRLVGHVADEHPERCPRSLEDRGREDEPDAGADLAARAWQLGDGAVSRPMRSEGACRCSLEFDARRVDWVVADCAAAEAGASSIWSAMRSSSPRAARSCCACLSAGATTDSADVTLRGARLRHRHDAPRSSKSCSSRSTRPTARPTAGVAEPAWAWRSASASSRPWARGSRSNRSPGKARASGSRCAFGSTIRRMPPMRTRRWAASTTTGPLSGTVLVVEDNEVNRMIARQVLLSLGVEVIEAADGAEALDVLEDQSVDLVLMDCQMPVMDGYVATRAIREREASKAGAACRSSHSPPMPSTTTPSARARPGWTAPGQALHARRSSAPCWPPGCSPGRQALS